MAHILIIEDDSSINSMLRDALGNSGYTCAFSGTEGLLLLEREQFDLILLDLMLPGMRGDEVLRRGRQLTQVPFLVLSAVDSLESKVELLTPGGWTITSLSPLRSRSCVPGCWCSCGSISPRQCRSRWGS